MKICFHNLALKFFFEQLNIVIATTYKFILLFLAKVCWLLIKQGQFNKHYSDLPNPSQWD